MYGKRAAKGNSTDDDDASSPKPPRAQRGGKIVKTISPPSSSGSQVQRGWLFRKELVEGSEETWRKRWVVLDIETVSVWKNPNRTPETLCESVPTHFIREMSFGAALDDRKDFAFMFTTMDEETTEFSASTLAERDEWLSALRVLIPLAKVKRDTDLMAQTTKMQALIEVQERLAAEALETIQLLHDRVRPFSTFRTYAKDLHNVLLELFEMTEKIGALKVDACRKAAYWIVLLVDLSNSVIAKCQFEKSAAQIFNLTRDLVTGISVLINNTTQVNSNSLAPVHIEQSLKAVHSIILRFIEEIEVATLQEELKSNHTEYRRSCSSLLQYKILTGRWGAPPQPLSVSPGSRPTAPPRPPIGLASGGSSTGNLAQLVSTPVNPGSPSIRRELPSPPIVSPPATLSPSNSLSDIPTPSPPSQIPLLSPATSPGTTSTPWMPIPKGRPLPPRPKPGLGSSTNNQAPSSPRGGSRRSHLFAFEPLSIADLSPPTKSPLAVMKTAQELNNTMKRVIEVAKKGSSPKTPRKQSVPLRGLDHEGIERFSRDLTDVDVRLAELLDLMREMLKLDGSRIKPQSSKAGNSSTLVSRVVEVMAASTGMLELLREEKEVDEHTLTATLSRVESALLQLKESATSFAADQNDSSPDGTGSVNNNNNNNKSSSTTEDVADDITLERARAGTFGLFKDKHLSKVKDGHRRSGSLGSVVDPVVVSFMTSLSGATKETTKEEEVDSFIRRTIANEELERIRMEEREKAEVLRDSIAEDYAPPSRPSKSPKPSIVPSISSTTASSSSTSNSPAIGKMSSSNRSTPLLVVRSDEDEEDVTPIRKPTKRLERKKPEAAPLPKAIENRREMEATAQLVRRASQRLSKVINRRSMVPPSNADRNDLSLQVLQQASCLTDLTAAFIELSITAQQEIEESITLNLAGFSPKSAKNIVACSQNVAAHIQQLAMVASQAGFLDKDSRVESIVSAGKCLKASVASLMDDLTVEGFPQRKELTTAIQTLCAATEALEDMVKREN